MAFLAPFLAPIAVDVVSSLVGKILGKGVEVTGGKINTRGIKSKINKKVINQIVNNAIDNEAIKLKTGGVTIRKKELNQYKKELRNGIYNNTLPAHFILSEKKR